MSNEIIFVDEAISEYLEGAHRKEEIINSIISNNYPPVDSFLRLALEEMTREQILKLITRYRFRYENTYG